VAVARCRRCRRILKIPESIEAGYGSYCYRLLFGKTIKPNRNKVTITSRGRMTRIAHPNSSEIAGQLSIDNVFEGEVNVFE